MALLDGSQADDVTAFEIGYFFARKKTGQMIIGIPTDFRRAGECDGTNGNSMIECPYYSIVQSEDELLKGLGIITQRSNNERFRD